MSSIFLQKMNELKCVGIMKIKNSVDMLGATMYYYKCQEGRQTKRKQKSFQKV